MTSFLHARHRHGRSAPALLVTAATLLLALGAASAVAQQQPAGAAEAAPGSARDTSRVPQPSAQVLARLSYDREFFTYDSASRRDPFQPLLDVGLDTAGPRFDELVLTGVFVGDAGEGMVVVEDAERKGYFLKPGELVGKATLVEILPDAAVFDVRDFGISRRETLKLQRPEEVS